MGCDDGDRGGLKTTPSVNTILEDDLYPVQVARSEPPNGAHPCLRYQNSMRCIGEFLRIQWSRAPKTRGVLTFQIVALAWQGRALWYSPSLYKSTGGVPTLILFLLGSRPSLDTNIGCPSITRLPHTGGPLRFAPVADPVPWHLVLLSLDTGARRRRRGSRLNLESPTAAPSHVADRSCAMSKAPEHAALPHGQTVQPAPRTPLTRA